MTGQGVCSSGASLFYIPTAEEIVLSDRKSSNGLDVDQQTKSLMNKQVEFFSFDESIRKLYKRPTQVSNISKEQFKLESNEMYGVRKVWFNETESFSEIENYKILVYVSQILGIFDLEYTMMRNATRGVQLLELETKT